VPGDNLSKIAWWFHTHGYGALYEANKAVLGDKPRPHPPRPTHHHHQQRHDHAMTARTQPVGPDHQLLSVDPCPG